MGIEQLKHIKDLLDRYNSYQPKTHIDAIKTLKELTNYVNLELVKAESKKVKVS